MIKNERVMKILEFIDKFKVCDVTHIARLYYRNNKYSVQDAQLKLTKLVKEKTLKRIRSDINSRYIYYCGKEPAQIQHKLLITELYVRLVQEWGENNIEIITEYTQIKGMRPDAFIKAIYNRRMYYYFVEVHISNNHFNFEKYENLYISGMYTTIFPVGVFPNIIIISDRKIEPPIKSSLNYIIINKDFSNLFQSII